jgi:nitroreductase
MNYQDLIKNRRSIRNFTDKKVPIKFLREIVQDASLAPSACNLQPWRFIIIQNVDLIKKLSDDSKKNNLEMLKSNHESFLKRFENAFKNPSYNVFYNANSLIFVCGVKNPSIYQDCALAVAYLMFAATQRGLGSCWIGLGENIQDPELTREIGLTNDLHIIAPIIIGYPISIPEMPKRKAIIIKEIE